MRITSILTGFIAAGLWLDGGAGHTQTMQMPCGDTPPEYTAAWANFSQAIENNYGDISRLNAEQRSVVIGHALGRYAEAADVLDAECVKTKLDMDDMFAFMDGRTLTDFSKIRTDASRGLYDAEVRQLTGVTSTAAFGHRDFAQSSDGAYVAGAEVGGKIGLSDGQNIYYDDGSSAPLNGNGNSNTDNWFNDEFWGDLPNTPDGGAEKPNNYSFESEGGLGNVDNWRFASDYQSCYIKKKKTEETGADIYNGGLTKTSYLILATRIDGKYECYSGLSPGAKYDPAGQDREIEKMLGVCRKRINRDLATCQLWYRDTRRP